MHDRESMDPSVANMRIGAFLSRLPKAHSRALLLNYDGTLAPFSCNPEQAYPYPEIANELHRIQRETDTRLAIVTGRRASDIPRLLKLSGVEELLDFLRGWIAACRVNDNTDCEYERESVIRRSTTHDNWRRSC